MKTKRTNNIRVIKDEINPESPEILALSLIRIGEAMEKLTSSPQGLTKEAIAILVANMPGHKGKISKSDVMLVMEGLNRLRSYYIRA